MDNKLETFYRQIFADLQVDREEAQELKDFFTELNPPPDRLVCLRAKAFKVGCEFLSSEDREINVAILRTINAIVHSLEHTTQQPRPLEGTDAFEYDKVTEFYQSIYGDLSVDQEENQSLYAFFATDNPPPTNQLIATRAAAFKVGCDFLSEDNDTEANTKLLRCINVVVHSFERSCLVPRPYQLKFPQQVVTEMTVESIGLKSSLDKAAQHLWDLDVNRLRPGQDYAINVQRGKKPFWKEDSAPDPLFDRVDERHALRRPTYRTFVRLLDNYITETGEAEHVTDAERSEIWTFLRAIMETAPMQFCHKYCHANQPDRVPSSQSAFLKLLHRIWFNLYRRGRGGRKDSSGFEHVFVGEVKNGVISGFHNWIQFYLEEKKGALDYRGYIKPRSRSDAVTNEDDHVLTLQFSWNGVEKAVGTCFIGVSPEFEMALYTTCFLVGGEENLVTLDTGTDIFDLSIKCFRHDGDKIGTCFPEAIAHYEE